MQSLQARLAASWRPAKSRQPSVEHAPRVVVMGIGQEMFGDDGAGVETARRLKAAAGDHLLVIEACYVPENFTGSVRKFAPDLVLLVDAAHMGQEPGAVAWLDWRDAVGFSASTHTGPLSSLANFMATTMDCEVWIIGIEPADLTMYAPLSPVVDAAVTDVATAIAEAVGAHVDGRLTVETR